MLPDAACLLQTFDAELSSPATTFLNLYFQLKSSSPLSNFLRALVSFMCSDNLIPMKMYMCAQDLASFNIHFCVGSGIQRNPVQLKRINLMVINLSLSRGLRYLEVEWRNTGETKL